MADEGNEFDELRPVQVGGEFLPTLLRQGARVDEFVDRAQQRTVPLSQPLGCGAGTDAGLRFGVDAAALRNAAVLLQLVCAATQMCHTQDHQLGVPSP